MLVIFAAIALVIAPAVHGAAAGPALARAEIKALLDALAASGCRVNQNGTWYAAPEARTHLLCKLEAIKRRTPVPDTETFIALAATSSNLSGKPYLVQREGAPTVESRPWLWIA